MLIEKSRNVGANLSLAQLIDRLYRWRLADQRYLTKRCLVQPCNKPQGPQKIGDRRSAFSLRIEAMC